ncbi:MAG: YetF domain-containing protein [Pseudomonadota bacterium]
MEDVFALHNPWWQLVLRGVIVYLGILLFVRLSGKREVGQFTPFDLAVLLIISEAVSPALSGEEKSVTGGLIVLVTLFLLNSGLGWLTQRSLRLARTLEGQPELLLRCGKVDYDAMHRLNISHNDLLAALHREGLLSPVEAEFAILETDGEITVKKRKTSVERPS